MGAQVSAVIPVLSYRVCQRFSELSTWWSRFESSYRTWCRVPWHVHTFVEGSKYCLAGGGHGHRSFPRPSRWSCSISLSL